MRSRFGCSYPYAQKVLNQYNQNGEEGVKNRKNQTRNHVRGKKRLLSQSQLKKLTRAIALESPDGGDTITDFAIGTDKILAVSAVFGGGLSAGELPESSFVLGSTATTSDQRFVFDDASGELFFDRDGNGAAPQQLIATLSGVSNLSAEDIMLL